MSIKEACTSEDKEKVEKIQKTIDDIIFEAFNFRTGRERENRKIV